MARARAKTPSRQHAFGIGGGPQPYRQGDLDGLCGPYCVVNAVRLATYPQRRLRDAECAELFAALVAELADTGRLRTAVTDGTGKVGRLARRAGCWLRDEHGLELEVMRPFTKRRGPDPASCLRLVTEHLARPGTAAIVATEDHWTVARAVSGRRLLLFDSHDRRHFRLGTAFGEGSGGNRLCLHGTYLLRVPWAMR